MPSRLESSRLVVTLAIEQRQVHRAQPQDLSRR